MSQALAVNSRDAHDGNLFCSNPYDCRAIPIKDLPLFLNKLPEDDKASLRKPLPIAEIRFEIVKTMQGERSARSLKHQLEQITFKSMRHQCYCINQIVDADELLFLSATSCAALSRQQFHSFVSNYIQYLNQGGRKHLGRLPLLDSAQSTLIIDEIKKRQLRLEPMAITNLCHFILEQFHIPCSRRFVRDWISSHKQEVMIQYVKPAERSRAILRKEELQQYYTDLGDLLKETMPELIYNCDETGFSRRVTATKLRAVLCCDAEPEKAVYIQKPDETTVTLIACVSLAGKYLRPYIVVPSKSMNKEILTHVRPKKECMFVYHANGFSTHAIFCDWFQDVFLPKIRRQREKIGCATKKAILLFDGFSGHDSDRFRALAATNHVLLIKIPAHSSHLTQPLDQQVFQTLKGAYRRESAFRFIKDVMVRKVCRITKAFGYSVLPHIIRDSWGNVRIRCNWDENGEFTSISVEHDSVLQKVIPVSLEKEETTRRKRMKLSAPFGPINLDETKSVSEDRCPLCHSPRRTNEETPLQSASVEKDSIVQDIQEQILERLEEKVLSKGSEGSYVSPIAALEYLIENGRVVLAGRRHLEHLRETLVECKVVEIITEQARKSSDEQEAKPLELHRWTTTSSVVSAILKELPQFHNLPDMDERIFRILIHLVTAGVLAKRVVDPGDDGDQSQSPKFEFRLNVK